MFLLHFCYINLLSSPPASLFLTFGKIINGVVIDPSRHKVRAPGAMNPSKMWNWYSITLMIISKLKYLNLNQYPKYGNTYFLTWSLIFNNSLNPCFGIIIVHNVEIYKKTILLSNMWGYYRMNMCVYVKCSSLKRILILVMFSATSLN